MDKTPGNKMQEGITGTVYLSIEDNYHLDAQIKVFETVCKYLGLMDNNLPDEEIHYAEPNLYYYDQGKTNFWAIRSMSIVMQELDIKITLKRQPK